MIPDRSAIPAADVVIGVTFGILASANLVQGMWTADIEWLNLTLISLAVAIVMTPHVLQGRVFPVRSILGILLLVGSLALGFAHPALSPDSADKRLAILWAVAFMTTASFLALSNRLRALAFLTIVTGAAIIALVGQIAAPDPLALAFGRRTPTGLNAIGVGRLLGAGFIIALGAVLHARRYRLIAGVTAPLLLLGLIASASRGPIIGATIATAFLVLTAQIPRRAKAVIVTSASLVIAFVYQNLQQTDSRLLSRTGSGRFDLYTQAMETAAEHPTGVGWGNTYKYLWSTPTARTQGADLHAHNILLEFWLEAGVLAVLLFLGFLAIIALTARQLVASPLGSTLVALAILLLIGASLSSDVVGNRMMWVTFGMILALAPVGQAQRESLRPTPTAHRVRS